MYFRFSYEIQSYVISLQSSSLIINVAGARNAVIILSRNPADDNSDAKTLAHNLIQVLVEFEPPSKAAQVLRDRAVGPVPQPDYFDALPGPLKEFSNRLYDELADVAIDAFGVIRWRFSISGPPRPFRAGKLEWSDDNISWNRVPNRITMKLQATVSRRLNESDASEVAGLLSNGAREPLAHVLLREARANAHAKSHSSALMMAVVALEIGVKQIIGDLVPDAEWLAFNLPTPPVDKIIRDYIPRLPARLLVGENPIKVPSSLLETLKKAVTARNTAVHAGSTPPAADFIDRVLEAVSDLLLIFDYLAGNAWALNSLSPDTRDAVTSSS